MTSQTDLPDLNVWLAMTSAGHVHHTKAIHYWETEAAERVLFCSVTAVGLVRLVSQPKLMGSAVKSSAEAAALLQSLCAQPGVSIAEPEQSAWDIFYALVCGHQLPSKHCTDAYLAALAMANGWRLVSFDRAFNQFNDLHWLSLS
ncbi:TA system VapC family ribonuclease toxin [Cyanobium gracile]|uniref:Ribonuclease VapC n=1 Tax=Cyanobium gracile (strain ATCC 27147 / PCC 6307) TaxID=292564 RepID=K9P5N4_CYAGP|nr:TA system VapC family ribonuclease toxin [Cyanobium gracile]AFY28303.1 putative nucleic acid-binding protein, contains PIN domain [Cyanobium gracile PCC 6307]